MCTCYICIQIYASSDLHVSASGTQSTLTYTDVVLYSWHTHYTPLYLLSPNALCSWYTRYVLDKSICLFLHIFASYIQLITIEFETLGNTVLEAFSCGIPVVVPRTQGFCDTVSDKINGYLFEPRSVQDCQRYVWACLYMYLCAFYTLFVYYVVFTFFMLTCISQFFLIYT